MKRLIAITGVCTLLASAAIAQTATKDKEEAASPPTAAEVDAAVKTINDMTADAKKVEGYCAINKEMSGLKEGDDQKAEELSKKMDAYLSNLGPSYVDAFSIVEGVDPESADGKKIDAAMGSLDQKCGA